MSRVRSLFRPAIGATRLLLFAIAMLALAAVALLLFRESQWVTAVDRDPRQAFFSGPIGTEFVPLPVLQVLPDLVRSKRHFSPLGDGQGDWIDQFGFIRDPDRCDLPLGFTVSNYRPKSAAPSPVPFVGIGCATCHTSELLRPDGQKFLIAGTGNSSLNLFAFLDAFQAALHDPLVTFEAIQDAHRQKFGARLGVEDSLMIRAWLTQARDALEKSFPRFDEPFGAGRSLESAVTPTGPARTQPFRTLVRTVLDRPGASMDVYTKIAPVFHEQWQEWAQIDGSLRDLNARSAMAVLAAGATLQSMQVPEIAGNIRQATEYVKQLQGPIWSQAFPGENGLDPEALENGYRVYLQHCDSCHGHPDGARGWTNNQRRGEVVPLGEIQTDPARVTFRYFDELPNRLFEFFPDDHPFKFARDDIRPGPAGKTVGYVNKPLDAVFARAPYLHNGSVLTLAELINLKPRRPTFYRGRNAYDVVDVGLRSPENRDAVHYFEFDTTAPGNSNQGHDYPWKYREQAAGWNEPDLKSLLEFLKSL